MDTNFSPFKGSYVSNQFPSNLMFGMNGFHVSASGVIQGHHGPLVLAARQLGLLLPDAAGPDQMFTGPDQLFVSEVRKCIITWFSLADTKQFQVSSP